MLKFDKKKLWKTLKTDARACLIFALTAGATQFLYRHYGFELAVIMLLGMIWGTVLLRNFRPGVIINVSKEGDVSEK